VVGSSGGKILATRHRGGGNLKIKVVVHEAEEGGYWAEVPAIPGCATQGETIEELMANVHEAIEACLHVDFCHLML
jgi:predicted RNase H-like HicB family nuclease